MIFKSFLIEKNVSLIDSCFSVIFYGENIGLKDDLRILIKNYYKDYEIISLQQNDILQNSAIINEQILNNSLFAKKKLILISNATDKLKKNIIEITKESISDIKIIIFSENLDKKSSLRSHFEGGKNLGCVACYNDNEKTLSIYSREKLKDYTGLSQEFLNILIKNSNNDRKVLSQEIDKIKRLFIHKKIDQTKALELINNAYNLGFDLLRDACLEIDKKKLNKILGNMDIQNEKSYLYIANLSNRIEKLLNLNRLIDQNNDVDSALDSLKPKIFWKDKPSYKKQLNIWNKKKLEKAKKIIMNTEVKIKTKLNSISSLLIKNLIVELYKLGEVNV